ncbi:hypothetical protein KI387_022370, partial [Taxus chinensis]
NRVEIMSMRSWDARGELPPTGSCMYEESPMGKRDGKWGKIDFSLSGGEDDDDSPMDGRIK